MAPKMPVEQLDPRTHEVLDTYTSISEAARSVGLVPSAINNALNRGRISAGFFWRVATEMPTPHRPLKRKRRARKLVADVRALEDSRHHAKAVSSSVLKKPVSRWVAVDDPLLDGYDDDVDDEVYEGELPYDELDEEDLLDLEPELEVEPQPVRRRRRTGASRRMAGMGGVSVIVRKKPAVKRRKQPIRRVVRRRRELLPPFEPELEPSLRRLDRLDRLDRRLPPLRRGLAIPPDFDTEGGIEELV